METDDGYEQEQEQERNIFITGPPRSGKSTLIGEVIDEMDLKGEAEGLRTPEIRKDGERVGFKLLDIKSGDEGILAHVDLEEGPKVSRYRVNLDDLERFTKRSLKNHSEECEVLIIDEIGTMELFSEIFEKTVKELLKDEREKRKDKTTILAVLHRHHVDSYRDQGKVYDLGKNDYENVKEEIIEHIKDQEPVKK